MLGWPPRWTRRRVREVHLGSGAIAHGEVVSADVAAAQVRPGGGHGGVHAARSNRGALDCSLMTVVNTGLDPSGARTTGAPGWAPSGAGDHEHCCRAVSVAQGRDRLVSATVLTDRQRKISRHCDRRLRSRAALMRNRVSAAFDRASVGPVGSPLAGWIAWCLEPR